MKAAGRVRYVGITTSEGRRHAEMEKIMASQPIDFVQVTYNILDREVEERILPLAQDRGIAVIANRPFQEGALIRAVERHPLPAWAGEIGAASWAQIHPQVHRLPSGRHLRHSGHEPGGAREGEPRRQPPARFPMPRMRRRMAADVAAL